MADCEDFDQQLEVENIQDEDQIHQVENIKKIRQPQKHMSAYIAFMKNYKDDQNKLGLKEMSKIWQEMPTEQRQKYIQISDEDKERYQKELQEYNEYVQQNPNQNQEQEEDSDDVAFPLQRIKTILKSDESNKVIKKNVIVMMEQATELFADYLIKQSMQNMKENNRKILSNQDLYDIINDNHSLRFLRHAGIQEKKQEKEQSPKKVVEPIKEQIQPIVKNNKTLDLYFKKKN